MAPRPFGSQLPCLTLPQTRLDDAIVNSFQSAGDRMTDCQYFGDYPFEKTQPTDVHQGVDEQPSSGHE